MARSSRIGAGIVFVGKLAVVHEGEHRPSVGLVRVPLHGALQNATCCRMFGGADALKKAESAQHCLVRRQALFVLDAQLFADPSRQDAILISHGGDDTRYQIILQRKNTLWAKGAFIVFRPEPLRFWSVRGRKKTSWRGWLNSNGDTV
ncbi:MAG: hypothetical protein WBQ43_23965 [Terriglobales bacterium]